MREIDLNEYEKLRAKGETLLGRVIPAGNTESVIYYAIDENQKTFCATEILDTLKLTHVDLKGRFDVIRHWTVPENKAITY